MLGLHLTADLFDCRAPLHTFCEAEALQAAAEAAVRAQGLVVVGSCVHRFADTPMGPGGVTATVLLAESHVCVHTWPERRGVTLDVYVCNQSADHSAAARAVLNTLIAPWQAGRSRLLGLWRGEPPAQALVLAAGRGQRMRPLSDHTPKPLLVVQGAPLLQWHHQALQRAGFVHQLVNTAWLEDQILDWIDGQNRLHHPSSGRWQLSNQQQFPGLLPPPVLLASTEGRDFGHALETLGGICRARPRLAPVFWVVGGDVYAPDFPFSQAAVRRFVASEALAHLWLVPNPPQHPQGDFGISAEGLALNEAPQRLTFSTIALYRQALFDPPWCDIPPGNPTGVQAPLAPLLRRAIAAGQVTAERHDGLWADVGTPERLAALNGQA